jgi:hypothetical protein
MVTVGCRLGEALRRRWIFLHTSHVPETAKAELVNAPAMKGNARIHDMFVYVLIESKFNILLPNRLKNSFLA